MSTASIPSAAGARTAGFALAAVLARPVGGVLADKIGPKPVVIAALAGVAVLAWVVNLQPDGDVPAGLTFVAMAAALGLGTGGVFAWVGVLAPEGKVGSISGVVSAAGGLGGYFPPLIMGATYDAAAHSYAIGLLLLVATALAALVFTIFAMTDVPESGDWWDAGYLMMWGSNVPVTRTPDAHWMAEVRYRGTKVVTVSPDYADNTKFADEWLPAQAGTDAALAMAMGHVMLKEFFVEREVPFFSDYVRQYTDLPFLVRLERRDDGSLTPSKFLTARDLPAEAGAEDAAFRTVLFDKAAGRPAVPNGSMGFRYSGSGEGKWNLDLEGIEPALSLREVSAESAEILLPCFEDAGGDGSVLRRGVPVIEVEGQLVTTVFDLMLAQYGVGRDGLPGEWAAGYDDAATPYTPAWQEEITSVPAQACIRVAREFARNAEQSKGRSMIIMGAGICQWFHGDTTYRAVLALVMLTGCMGRNGGGWAHYVGQEKTRPVTGWLSLANALDWSRPPRTMIGTGYWYMHTDQWRQDGYSADALKSPLSTGAWTACTPPTRWPSPRGSAGCRSTRSSTATRWTSRTRRRPPSPPAPRRTPPATSRTR